MQRRRNGSSIRKLTAVFSTQLDRILIYDVEAKWRGDRLYLGHGSRGIAIPSSTEKSTIATIAGCLSYLIQAILLSEYAHSPPRETSAASSQRFRHGPLLCKASFCRVADTDGRSQAAHCARASSASCSRARRTSPSRDSAKLKLSCRRLLPKCSSASPSAGRSRPTRPPPSTPSMVTASGTRSSAAV